MSESEHILQPSCAEDPTYSSSADPQAGARLYACYLLVSQSPDVKSRNKTYIGFTVNPARRLRQHNREIAAGARRTKTHGPWMTVCVIHGFASKTQALQFEWAWQHPKRSLCLKKHFDRPDALRLPSIRVTFVNGRLQALAALTSVPPWNLCPLTLTMCAPRAKWDEYKIDCVVFPKSLRVTFASLDSFQTGQPYNYRQRCDAVIPSGNKCAVCNAAVWKQSELGGRVSHCSHCGALSHLSCFADCRDEEDLVGKERLLPNYVLCASCGGRMHWSLVVRLCRALETDDE